MLELRDYRGHLRNWRELCSELGIDASLIREEREKAEREEKWRKEREEREKKEAEWKKEHPILDKYTYMSYYNYDTYGWEGYYINVHFYEWSDINSSPRIFPYSTSFYIFCRWNKRYK